MKNKLPFRININAIAIYLFCTFLVFLAGSYITGIMIFFLYVMFIFPLVSFVLAIFHYRSVTFYQKFSTEHPVKGDSVEYSLILYNESVIPVPEVQVDFKSINPLMQQVLQNFAISLKKKDKVQKSCTLTCTYRGIYQVGLEYIGITDASKFLTLSIAVWHQTFYVYPRILSLVSFRAPLIRQDAKGETSLQSGLPDYTLYKQLRTYQEGDSLQHMYWKKFAATGIPFIKQYDSPGDVGVTLYFDIRRAENPTPTVLEREDVTVEIVTALVKYFLDMNICISVFSQGSPPFEFYGNIRKDFHSYYEATINLKFENTCSPAQLYYLHDRDDKYRFTTVIFITHIIDPELLNIIEDSLATHKNYTLIFNHQGNPEEKRKETTEHLNTLRDRGLSIIEVFSAETIVVDMEKTSNEFFV
ncbi:MAG: DUF58 domain-containing protein [Spirochaetales bacterium]|nr:DUF58 domain-containing protein [Spirochaetales bacterium]